MFVHLYTASEIRTLIAEERNKLVMPVCTPAAGRPENQETQSAQNPHDSGRFIAW
jgi:hypothetical protein